MTATPFVLLLKLLMAHLLADFVLQPAAWVASKELRTWRSPWFWAHLAVHGLLYFVLIGALRYWFLALLLSVVHGAIDLLKLHRQEKGSRARWFLLDQGLHVLSLMAVWVVVSRPDLSAMLPLWNSSAVWLLAFGVLTVTTVSGRIMQVLLSHWEPQLPPGKEEQLPKAGMYIGMLERLFIFGFILLGELEAIGFLLAAKSVFRFGDLSNAQNRNFTEYILIGTLLSFALAMGTAFLVRWLL